MIWDGDIDEYIELLKVAPYIGADTENSGTVKLWELWNGTHYCTGISTAIRLPDFNIWSYYFPFRHPSDNLGKEYIEKLRPILEEQDIGFHNAPIDIAALETLGIRRTKPVFDTIVMAHLVNEEFPSKELDWLSKFILKREKVKGRLDDWTKIWGWDDVPVGLMRPYACMDAELQYLLWEIFWKDMAA